MIEKYKNNWDKIYILLLILVLLRDFISTTTISLYIPRVLNWGLLFFLMACVSVYIVVNKNIKLWNKIFVIALLVIFFVSAIISEYHFGYILFFWLLEHME